MKVPETLVEAIESNDISGVRIILKNNLLFDPSGKTFDELAQYAESRMPNLFEENEGELNWDEESFSDEMMYQELANLMNNFSKERAELLKKMMKSMEGEKAKEHAQENLPARKEEEKDLKKLGIGLVAVGAATVVGANIYRNLAVDAAIGLCNGLTVGGAVAAIAGIALIAKEK